MGNLVMKDEKTPILVPCPHAHGIALDHCLLEEMQKIVDRLSLIPPISYGKWKSCEYDIQFNLLIIMCDLFDMGEDFVFQGKTLTNEVAKHMIHNLEIIFETKVSKWRIEIRTFLGAYRITFVRKC